jgi:hypothetical protein
VTSSIQPRSNSNSGKVLDAGRRVEMFWPKDLLADPERFTEERFGFGVFPDVSEKDPTQLDLKTAQQASLQTGSKRIKSTLPRIPPSSRLASPSASESPLNSDQVWVNNQNREVLECQIRATMAKPNRANTCPKKTQSKKGIGRANCAEERHG